MKSNYMKVNNCTGTPLTKYAWWTDRNGNKLSYWDGDHNSTTTGCQCFLSGDGCHSSLDDREVFY
jgi:hypothetical protein